MLNLKASLVLIVVLSGALSFGQFGWTWTPKAEMPFKISNNAVSDGEMSGNKYVYSFGGLDTTKIWSGITKRSFRYDVVNDVWDEIDTLPVVLPLIASSANTVKNKIYILGGYHVYSNGSETSSDEVIIYNPETNAYEPNGAPIPVPIDDQTQVVWRDSLIFVITGWSNTTNVPDVQIYDPALDQWQVGTDVPNTTDYKVFGSSGQIVGDTIYYYGGASTGFNFPARKELRKGVINPSDPTQITWTLMDDAPNSNYRSACITHGNDVFWIGGSQTSYNYNGVAYNGSGGVEPNFQVIRYETYWNDWYEFNGTPVGTMDMRGYGQVSSTEWIICGGMESGQAVSNKTYLLTYDPVTGGIMEKSQIPDFQLVARTLIWDTYVEDATLFGMDGQKISDLTDMTISYAHSGIFIVRFEYQGQLYSKRVFVP